MEIIKEVDPMLIRIIGGVVLGALAVAVACEIIDKENPELIRKVKNWFSDEDEFLDLEEEPAE